MLGNDFHMDRYTRSNIQGTRPTELTSMLGSHAPQPSVLLLDHSDLQVTRRNGLQSAAYRRESGYDSREWRGKAREERTTGNRRRWAGRAVAVAARGTGPGRRCSVDCVEHASGICRPQPFAEQSFPTDEPIKTTARARRNLV